MELVQKLQALVEDAENKIKVRASNAIAKDLELQFNLQEQPVSIKGKLTINETDVEVYWNINGRCFAVSNGRPSPELDLILKNPPVAEVEESEGENKEGENENEPEGEVEEEEPAEQ